MNKYSFTTVLISLLSLTSQAQESAVDYDGLMQQSNKMIAVILVLLIILIGIATFLFFLDKKVSKLEKQINQK